MLSHCGLPWPMTRREGFAHDRSWCAALAKWHVEEQDRVDQGEDSGRRTDTESQ